ncbi:polyprenyl synthetase family protein [Ornithobacterium rhinotracheale]|uniref:polyprenyl synthetase family protein n=1 Tax=Ornithobacterium rhinotracheale TaxID=28251 RepID=UPI00129C1DEB|nr:polyprenyl synthetase family protein [Ornithobacterium rhinotracheale]MRJ07530.1 polyprenyl synthetase family protein [Ornithobacterium rhinotracheale]UOH78124.1 polyprenyl synthetase family protein [Ornithobacterium rhinotracheale]
MTKIAQYQELIQQALTQNSLIKQPEALYEPMEYILQLGGKRLRPTLCLMGCELFGGDINEALKPSLAMEYFHNFTLMHDDIMDEAPIRRGQATVHEKYDINTALLSGDALMIKSYQLFNELKPEVFKKVVTHFSQMAIELCEGQQYDMNFENQKEVSFAEYEKMITGKTGVLTACALKVGAMIAGASEEDANHLYDFGKYLGIAFQLKDDLLDVFGDNDAFGKQHAGDIFENKKTILYIKALEKADERQRDELEYWYEIKTENIDKIYAVEKIFKVLNIDLEVGDMINEYTCKAIESLNAIQENVNTKEDLAQFAQKLIGRTF